VDYYCDSCGNNADYEIDGEHYCEKCAEEYIQEVASSLSLYEKAELLDIDMSDIWG
jgi:hypothetical protein